MAGTLPYIGSKISLISVSEIRYEGILYTINTQESTVALQTVRSFGTEGRKTPDVPPSNEIYDFIIFRGKDIKDLTVCEPAPPASVSDDPAVLSVNVAPGPGPGGAHHNESAHHYPTMMQKDHPYGMNNYHMGGMQQQRSPMPNNRINYSNMGGMPPVSRGYYGGGRGGYNSRPPLGGYDNYRGGYNSMRGRRVMNGSRIVGELAPQPNPGLKSQVATSFNFVENNSKFDKSSLKTDMSSAAANSDGEAAVAPNLPAVRPGYDKVASFFDNISCETLDRQSGHETRVDREKQRQLDSDTFGVAAGIVRGSRFRRGGRRSEYGRGGYNSYMGGFSNQNGYDHSYKHPGQVVGGR